jgi:hypothetical protein
MKLKFFKDVFLDGVIFANAGEIKEVPEENGSAQRWINRGAVPVSELEEVIVEDKELPDFDKMSKKELLKFAEDNGIHIPKDVDKVMEIKSFIKSLVLEGEVIVEDEF